MPLGTDKGEILAMIIPAYLSDKSQTPRLIFALILLLITACGMSARLYATGYSYSHVDEEIARAVVSKVLQTGSLDTNWARTDVDAAFRYDEYNFSSYYLFASGIEYVSGHRAEDLAHPYTTLRLNLRALSAMLGGLCILFAGVLGLRLGGMLTGIMAALLTACSPNLFQDSLYARPEAFVTLLSLLFCLALTLRSRGGLPALALAGLFAGLLIACKFTFLMYLPFPLLLIPSFTDTSAGGRTENQRIGHFGMYLLVYLILILIGFYIGAPYALKFPWEYLGGVDALMRQYLGANVPEAPHGLLRTLQAAVGRLGYYVYTLGYPVLILALAGLYSLIRKAKARDMLILASPLLTLAYFLQTQLFMERNASQAVPILCLLAGLAVEALWVRLHVWKKLRSASVAVLMAICLIAPISVTATIMDPVLDGGYQSKIDLEATTLSENGTVPVLYVGKDTGSMPVKLCGSYVLMTRVKTYSRELRHLLDLGYTVDGRVVSPLGPEDYSLATLLAPTTTFLAAPPMVPGSCAIGLSPLDTTTAKKLIHAPVDISGGWSRDGAPASAAAWESPLYGSWSGSDANVGAIKIGPFKACGDFAIPFAAGPARTHTWIQITRSDGKTDEVIYSGLPPATPYKWEQLEVLNPADTCRSYTISGTDDGKGWGEWIGLGTPVTPTAKPHTD